MECAEFIAAGDVAERSANIAVARREENAAGRYGINVHIAGRAARGKLAARLNVFQAEIAADRFDLNAAGAYELEYANCAAEDYSLSEQDGALVIRYIRKKPEGLFSQLSVRKSPLTVRTSQFSA